MKRFNRNSLESEIICLICIMVLGVFLAGIYSLGTVVRSNQVNYNERCAEDIAEFENLFMQKYYKLQSIMSACEYNENVQRLLSGVKESAYEVISPIENMETNLLQMLYNYSELDEAVQDVYIMGENERLYTYIYYHNDKNLQQVIAESSRSGQLYMSDIFELGSMKCFAMIGSIRRLKSEGNLFYFLDEEVLGRSIFTVKVDFLKEQMEQMQNAGNSIYLLDRDGNIILEAEGQLEASPVLVEVFSTFDAGNNGIESMIVGDYIINTKRINENGWRIAITVPKWSGEFLNLKTFDWLIIWPLLLVGVFVFAFSIIRNLNRFVLDIVTHMRKIGDGDLDARILSKNKQEFRQVTDGLNQMMDDIHVLMEKNIALSTKLYQEETEKTSMMLLALQSQMNPHFLYNTIECIKNIGICYDVKEIEQLSTALSGVLRYSLSTDNIVYIAQEIECIENYITIQAIRFEGKYDVKMEIDQKLLNKPILRLSLQPLVENAMKHGLKGRQSCCILHIRIYEDETTLYLQVEDNGIGMSPEMVRELLAGKKESSGSIGIANLINRLRLFYGEDAHLDIESESGRGTSMTICILKKSIQIAN